MSKILVGIPIPTSLNEAYNQASWPAYAAAIQSVGGEAVAIPLDLSDRDLEVVAAGCEAYLLPGSEADVHPENYGQKPEPECGYADPARERVDRFLISRAARHKLPMLCICFGTQMVNTVHGGTLIQHLTPMPVNHPAGRAVQVAHTVLIAPHSTLAASIDLAETKQDHDLLRLPVNSSHHQAIAIPGDGLRVVARSSEDGVIEAVEGDPAGPFLLAVQWHPERTMATSPSSRAIFTRFLTEAAKARG